MHHEDQVTHFAEANGRSPGRVFGIRRRDRRSHMYIIGKTGTGKSTLLYTLARRDILNGEGLALLDPHGDMVERIAATCPEYRRKDLIYFNVPDPSDSHTFNPLEYVTPDRRSLIAAGLLEVFRKTWTGNSWGVRLEHILRNALLTLVEQPTATLADILRLLDDKAYLKTALRHLTNEQVRRFWFDEWANYPVRYQIDAAAPIRNKVGAFLADPLLNRILGGTKGSLNLREIMDGRKILLVNLAKGKIGEDSATLLGSLLVSQLGSTGLSRADTPEANRPDFYVYLDEFQTFTTLSLATMLAELRKYRVNMTLANQYLSQMEPEVRDAILGNIGTLITFRLGPSDATFLAKEFEPEFMAEDLMRLSNYHIYLKLMINGTVSRPFSAVTLPQS
jgi:hypothetical protein